MSGKQLSVRQAVSHPKKAKKIAAHDELDLLVDQLLRGDKDGGTGTADEILSHPQVKKHGLLGRLSSGQQSLVTSVVSIMQDRVAGDARKNADALKQIIIHEREALSHMSRSFAETAKNLYQLPLLTQARNERESALHEHAHHQRSAHSAGVPQGPTPPVRRTTVWERFFTWGNLVSFTAILLAVLVVKTSVETASFETRYRLTKENLTQAKIELEKLQVNLQLVNADSKKMAEEHAGLTTRVEEMLKQQVTEKQRHDAELQAQVAALNETKQVLARQQAQLVQAETSKSSGQSALKDQISALQQQLAATHGKQTQQDESALLWKQLAEERKDEIAKLQSALLKRDDTTLSTDNKSAGKRFLGLF